MGRSRDKTNGKPRPVESVGPADSREPLRIVVGWQGDGGVYRLDLASERRIREAYPDALVISDGMLLGYDKKRDYNRYHRPYWEQIARMLTGLNDEQIANLGGVKMYDTIARKEIWSWMPRAVIHQ